MKHIQPWLSVVIFLICSPAFAEDANTVPDPFQEIAAKYRTANPKPQLPEEARKFKVQAEFAVQEKQFTNAADLYGKALDIAPWWPEGHFNRALILGETKKYWDAMREMKRYLLLVPDAPDARAAQDKIYVWDEVAGPETPLRFGVYGVSSATSIWSGKSPPRPQYADSFIEGGNFASAKKIMEDKCDTSLCDLIVKVTCSVDGGSPPAKAVVISAFSHKTLYTVTQGSGGGWGAPCMEDSNKLGMVVSQKFAPGTALNKSAWTEKEVGTPSPADTKSNPVDMKKN